MKTWVHEIRRLCFVLLSVVLPVMAVAQRHTLVVEGWITNDIPSEPLAQSKEFQLRTDGDKWIMRLSGPLGPKQYFEIFFDGKKTCYLNNMKALIEEKKAEGKQVGDNVANAIIRPGPVPYFTLIEDAGLLWLTYLSGPFLAGNQALEGFITPPCRKGIMGSGDVRTEDLLLQRYRRTADRVNSLGVPKRVEYFFAATNLPGMPRSIGLKEVERQFYSQTNAVFEVLNVAQVNTTRIPERSRLVVLKPAEISGQAIDVTFFLHATNITVGGSNTNLVPEIPGLTHFTDHRFANAVRPLLFFSYEGTRWLSDREVKRLPQYQWALGRVPPAELSRTGKVLFFAVLVLLLLFPAFMALISRQLKKKSAKH
jgi:hypothetical protein